jgi:uncharacterized protein
MSSYFVYRLIPPRPSFIADMRDEERTIMGQHGQHWQGLMSEGKVLVYGPVRDGTGGWGLGVIEAEDLDEARAMVESDPAISSGMARLEFGPMVTTILRPGADPEGRTNVPGLGVAVPGRGA